LRLAAFYEKAGLNKEEAGKLAYLNMLDSQTTLSDLEEKQYRALKEKIDKLTSKELSPPDP
jgi:hypothetical protein